MKPILTSLILTMMVGSAVAMEPVPVLEAWCDGGIDGRYQHATVTPDGEIRAAQGWLTEKPWPVVGHDREAAQRWFAAVGAAKPIEPRIEDKDPMPDAIYCGLKWSSGELVLLYDLPDVHRELVLWVPNYH